MAATWYVSGDPAADAFVAEDPLAFLVGMLLDQQVPLEWAFRGPHTLRDRLGRWGIDELAALTEDRLVEACCTRPAVHRFPAVMGRRVHALVAALQDAGYVPADRLWSGAADADDLFTRLLGLPGFGQEKAQITIAALAKRFGVCPEGWARVAAPFSDSEPRSVADCADAASAARVRAWKAAARAAGIDKQGRPLPRRPTIDD